MTTAKAPEHLSAQAQAYWRRVLKEYDLSGDGLQILQVACEQLDLAALALADIRQRGIIVGLKRNPACDLLRAAHALYLRAVRQLGIDLSPAGPGRPPEAYMPLVDTKGKTKK